jgi:hypothetical protein
MYCVKLTRNYKLKNKDLQLGIRNKFNASQKLRIVQLQEIVKNVSKNKIMKIKNGTQCQGRNIQVNTFSSPSLLIYYGFYSNLHLLFRIQLR